MRDIIRRLFSLDDAVALVTGSSGGIGLSLARGLAEAGARVMVNGRDSGKVAAAVASMKSDGLLADAAVFDVTDPERVERGVASIEHEIGPIHVLVNNAGIQRRSPLEDFSPETWRELMRTNLDAVFYVGQAVARRMIPRGKGQIINIASVQSELARTNIAPYTASKGAVKMLTKGMATDWGKHGLRANALAPGYFRTELNKALVEDEKFPPGSRPGRRLAAGATCRSWSAPQSFLHRTRQASSTGMCCTWTKALRPASDRDAGIP